VTSTIEEEISRIEETISEVVRRKEIVELPLEVQALEIEEMREEVKFN
jgi:hypothetical protein